MRNTLNQQLTSAFAPLCCIALLFLSFCGCSQRHKEAATPSNSSHPRIVSLAPSLTEMLFAIGAGEQVVGRTSACDWPAEARKVTVVGGFGRPSLEMLASLSPDLVVDVDLAEEQAEKKITALNISRERIRCSSPDDIPPALRKLGRLTGHTKKADSLATVIANGLEKYRQENARNSRKTSVYLEIWDDPLWTGGKNSFTSSLISCAGGYNIGDAVRMEYFQVSPEWVIKSNPEVIACMYMSRETPAGDKVKNRPGWSGISAVKNGKVYDRFDNNLYLRPGPRILEGIAGMKALIERE